MAIYNATSVRETESCISIGESKRLGLEPKGKLGKSETTPASIQIYYFFKMYF